MATPRDGLAAVAFWLVSCRDSPCQNGGVCVNLPRVEVAFRCDCPSHYGGPTCETYCGPDQECVSLAELAMLFVELVRLARACPVQCEDDPAFLHNNYETTYTCADMNDQYDCVLTDDNTGVSAAEACPASCGTGCGLTFDSCWNSPCQNGGVCVNLPGVEAFTCNCPAGFCTENCATADALDHSDGNPNCPVRLCSLL